MRQETDAMLAKSARLIAEAQALMESARLLLKEQAHLLKMIKSKKADTPDSSQPSEPPK
jgi:hypothetical protein